MTFFNFFRDREFFNSLLKVGLPITLQSLVSSSLNFVDVMMIGQLGETAVASVGLANQVFFVFMLLLFGVSTGASIFTAQYWGKKDIPSIHKVVGLCLGLCSLVGVAFFIIAAAFPQLALSLYSEDSQVITLGSQYLHSISLSFLFLSISTSYSAALRSSGNVRLPVIVSSLALGISTLLNYGLILGNFGLPAMGVQGAALSNVIARTFECFTLLAVTYLRKLPAAATPRQMIGFSKDFVALYLKTTMPVIINEGLWSLGVSLYNAVYARISTDAIASVNIANTILNLAFVLFNGVGIGAGIMIGNKLGEGQIDRAYEYARKCLYLGVGGAVLIGAGMIFSGEHLLSLYKISPATLQDAQAILVIYGITLWSKVANLIMVAGIFRSGGDTRFAMLLDVGGVWLIGLPMILLGAFIFKLPVHLVVLCALSEEAIKALVGFYRFHSRKWINILV